MSDKKGKSGISLRKRQQAEGEAVEPAAADDGPETIEEAFGDSPAKPEGAQIAKFPTAQSHGNVVAMKAPPHSQDAEQAILGGLMIDPNAFEQIADRIDSESFYFYDHKLIFKAIERLQQANKPCDGMMVAETLDALGQLDQIGRDYLVALVDSVFTAANIGAYADIVQDHALKRRILGIATDVSRMGLESDGQSAKDLLSYAEKEIYQASESITKTEKGFTHLNLILSEAVDTISDLYENGGQNTGLSTGFSELDEMTTGLHPGELVIVAARPSMGKTTFAMNIAENVAIESGKHVAVFSMEMPKDQLAMRMISSLGRIEQGRVRNGRFEDQDWQRLAGAIQQLSNANIHIDDTPALSPTDMRSRARRLAKNNDLGLIVVDYLQLMQIPGSKENRTNEVSEISRSLKALAKELEVPVIALSQLNRSLEQRTNRKPVMSDLRESGAIEQDADLITFIYRDVVYNPDTEHKDLAEIIIGKQRNGPTGSVMLRFLGKFTRFENFQDSMGAQYGYGDDYLPSQSATRPPSTPPSYNQSESEWT